MRIRRAEPQEAGEFGTPTYKRFAIRDDSENLKGWVVGQDGEWRGVKVGQDGCSDGDSRNSFADDFSAVRWVLGLEAWR